MAPCPPDERLTALIENAIDDVERATLGGHVADCTVCQDRLDRLTDAPGLEAWLTAVPTETKPYPFLAPATNRGDLGRLNGYAIRSEIGRGGMGLVLRGWDETLARDVAIKVLRPEGDAATGEARFTREARAVARLRHDHVVPLFAVDRTADGRPFLVMPYVPGVTLRERLRSGPLPPREAAELVRQVADGLAAAHAGGLIHRDVKPANVLLDASDGRAKLTDFGLVRAASDAETLSPDGFLAGTPAYMSPEQASTPERIDARADVYALGITLYECLTGTVPFLGSPLAVLERHRTVEPVPPRRLNADVATDLETVCLTAIAKSPASRYASAAAFRDDLALWLEGRPIRARPAGPVERARRWCGRNPLPVTIVLVSLIGSVAAAAGWWRAGVKADLARQREAEAVAARALADERSALALGAITTLVTKAQALADTSPGTLTLKRQLNEAALADLRKLAESTAKVPGVDRSILLAHEKLGNALHLLGQTDEAVREWDRVLDLSERLVAADPDDDLSRRDAARAHYRIGHSRFLLSDFPTALTHMNASVGILEGLRAKAPHDRATLRELVVGYNGRADVERATGRAAESLADSERALDAIQTQYGLDSSDAQLRTGLFFSHNKLAYTYTFLRHDYEKADFHFREELRRAEEQRAAVPDDLTWLRHYHIALLDLSSIQQRRGEFEAGEKSARDAFGWLEAAAARDPENVLTQRDFAMAHIHLGNVRIGQKKYAEAEKSYVEALAVLDRAAARSNSISMVAVDIQTLCVGLVYVCERQDRFADAATWADRTIAAAKANQTTPAQIAQSAPLVARLTDVGEAFRLVPNALADPTVIETQKPDVAMWLTIFRAKALARRGDHARALREIRELVARNPTQAEPPFSYAAVCGEVASATANESERRELIETGATALIDSIRLNRLNLMSVHLAPELNEIRADPSFASRLRALLDEPSAK